MSADTLESTPPALVTKTATPWAHSQMQAWIIDAFKRRGVESRAAVLILHAKMVLETGRKGSMEGVCCWNYNVGNMRGVSSQHLYTVLSSAWEYINGAVVIPTDQRFQAFTSHQAGIDALLDYLVKRQPMAWRVLTSATPTPEAYATGARAGGYFTAPLYDVILPDGNKVAGYIPILRSIYDQFDALWTPRTARITDKELQTALQRLGFDPGPIDGIIGPKTRNAIRCFQRSHNLIDDGRPSDTLRATVVAETMTKDR